MEKNIEEVLQHLDWLNEIELGSYVIKYKGKAIRLANGKRIWKAPGHAKSALANHCKSMYNRWPKAQSKSWGFKNATELAQYLVTSGTLTVEQL